MNSLFDKLLILRSPGVGPVAYEKLIRQFGSVAAAAESLDAALASIDDAARELHGAIRGSELFVYEGLGHGAYEEAKDFYKRVFDFCDRREPAGGGAGADCGNGKKGA